MKTSRTNYLIQAIIATIFCSFTFNLNGQSVGVSTGIGYSTFIDLEENFSYMSANYEKGSHQFLRLDLDSYLPDAKFISLHFKLERSKSSITSMYRNVSFCGLGFFPLSRPDINSDITLYKMSVGVMPINLKIYNNIRFKAGTELTRVFKSSVSERIDESSITGDIAIFPRNTDEEVFKEYGVGFIFELQLGKFQLGKDLSVVPIYNSSVSLTEDIHSGFYTRTLRQSLGLAFKWNMKPKLKIQ